LIETRLVVDTTITVSNNRVTLISE
jgi:hypothetical protein